MNLINHYLSLITDLYINNLGMLGALIVVILGSFIPPVPDAVFFAFTTNSFGLVNGIIISYLGTVIGASLVYLMSFSLSKVKWVNNLLNGEHKISFYAKRFRHIKLSTLSICVAIPFLPAVAIHVASGLVRMDYRKILVALLIGKIFLVIFWALVGQSVISGLTNPITLIILVIILVLVYFISKYISKKYKLED